jgi:hypothetical protein
MAFDISKGTTALDEAGANALFAEHADAIGAAEDNEDIDGVIDLESLCSGKVRLHEGDLAVDELHLKAGSPSLFITGNLTVTGMIQQDFRAGFLVVFGDVTANHLVAGAQIFISGKLTVTGTIFGNCTNYPTLVLGRTKAATLVSAKEHYFCFYGGQTIKRVVDAQGDTPNLEAATDGQDALVDGIDKGHDTAAVVKLLRAGKPIIE